MGDVKPQVNAADVLALVRGHFADAHGLVVLQAGQVSQTFAFSAGGTEYVVRFNTPSLAHVFRKEAYIYRHFATPDIPMPAIAHVGQWRDLSYAISRRAPGVTLDKLPDDEYLRTLPALIAILDAIRQVDVSGSSGYGEFDDSGAALASTWHGYLRAVAAEEEPGGFFGKWHSLFAESFLARDVFDNIYARMLALLEYCPAERYLVHGDFGADNALAAGGRITAVIDWANAKYGDFVYDVAWLDFWAWRGDFAARWQQYCAEQGIALPFFRERLLCYKCYTTLVALRFFAKVGSEASYSWTRDRLLALLDE